MKRVLGTLMLTPPITLLLWASFLQLGLGLVGFDALAGLLRPTTSLVIRATEALAALPLSQIEVVRPPAYWMVVTYLVLLLCALRGPATASGRRPGSKRRRRLRALRFPNWALLGIVGFGWLLWAARPSRHARDALELVVLDVGNGSAGVLTAPSGATCAIDAGSLRNMDVAERVAQTLWVRRLQPLTWIALSHPDMDHFSGIPNLLRRFPMATFRTPPGFQAEISSHPSAAALAGALPAQTDQQAFVPELDVELGGARCEVLWPQGDVNHLPDNDRSLVLKIHANGRSILIPGDIETLGMQALLKLQAERRIKLQADVLIAPHHGAVIEGVTRGFYQEVQPEIVVASTAREQPKLEQLIHDLSGHCRLYVTRDFGAVIVRIGLTGEISVQTPYALGRRQ